MYSVQNPETRDSILPNADQQIMFSADDCLESGYKDPHQLSIPNGLIRISSAYPIVRYYSENTDNLNHFVKEIVVAIVSGKEILFDSDKVSKQIEDEVYTWLTNPSGNSVKVFCRDFCKLLYQKPDLTVTPEGILLFYTPSTLFVTFDGTSGLTLNVQQLASSLNYDMVKSIRSIYIDDDNNTVLITFIRDDGENLDGTFKLSITFNFLLESGIELKISEE